MSDEAAAPAGDDGSAALAEAVEAPGGAEAADPDLYDVDELPEDLAKKRFKRIVNGRERVVTLAEALKLDQTHAAATEKYQSAAQLRKDAETFVASMLHDPENYIKHAGPEGIERAILAAVSNADPKVQKAVERALTKAYEESQLSDEERASRQKETALEKREREVKEREDAIARERHERETRAAMVDIHRAFGEALTKVGLKADNARALARMAAIAEGALDHEIDLSPDEIAQQVASEWAEDVGGRFEGLTGDALLDAAGSDLVKRINEASVARIKRARSQPRVEGAPAPAPQPKKGERPMTTEEYRKRHGYLSLKNLG